jgi:hypothetical protein
VWAELKTIRHRVASFPLSFVKGKGEVRGIRLRRKERGTKGVRWVILAQKRYAIISKVHLSCPAFKGWQE